MEKYFRLHLGREVEKRKYFWLKFQGHLIDIHCCNVKSNSKSDQVAKVQVTQRM